MISHLGTVFLFAARYAHHRQTGAALAVVTAIKAGWDDLTPQVKKQLQQESHEATFNPEDWNELRKLKV